MPPSPVPEVCSSLPSVFLEGTKGHKSLCCLRGLLDYPDQQPKWKFLLLSTEYIVNDVVRSLATPSDLTSIKPMKKKSLIYFSNFLFDENCVLLFLLSGLLIDFPPLLWSLCTIQVSVVSLVIKQ